MAKRMAVVDAGRCAACGTCVKECPREAVRVWKGCYALVDPERCVGCGRCGKVCPAVCIEMRQREEGSR